MFTYIKCLHTYISSWWWESKKLTWLGRRLGDLLVIWFFFFFFGFQLDFRHSGWQGVLNIYCTIIPIDDRQLRVWVRLKERTIQVQESSLTDGDKVLRVVWTTWPWPWIIFFILALDRNPSQWEQPRKSGRKVFNSPSRVRCLQSWELPSLLHKWRLYTYHNFCHSTNNR